MRRINAPGIEINEIDKSAYSQITDESLTDTATLVMGFADKGFDYKTNFVNNINTFNLLYGNPTTEAERYFYHAAKEVLDNRGVLYCAKLPYYNDSKDKYSFTTYTLDTKINVLSTPYEQMIDYLPYVDKSDEDVYRAEYPLQDTSFYSIMTLNYLPLDYLKIIDNNIDNDDYLLIEELMNYIYTETNLEIYYKDTFDYYFKNIFGIYRLKKILAVNGSFWISQQYIKSEQEDDTVEMKIESLSDRENLKEIRSLLLKHYENGMTDILFEFGNSRTLEEFKKYYSNLQDTIGPLLNAGILSSKTETLEDSENHDAYYFKIYYNNLSNFVNLNFYNNHISELSDRYDADSWNKLTYRHGDMKRIDNTISSYIEIKSIEKSAKSSGLLTIDDLDKLRTYKKRPLVNTFQIVDITKTKYGKTSDQDLECVGILPVITTAAHSIYYNSIIKNEETTESFNVLSKIQTIFDRKIKNDLDSDSYYDKNLKTFLFDQHITCQTDKSGYGDTAISYFPDLKYTATQKLDRNYLKQIGVVVFQMRRSSESTSRIQLVPVEAFVGSLNRNSKDMDKGSGNFIDDIINDRSNYINFFSNFQFDDEKTNLNKASIFLIKDQTATSLGFYEYQTEKNIKVQDSIIDPMIRIFDNNKNIDEISLDLILDAGVSTIAQFIESTSQSNNNIGKYDLADLESKNFSIPIDNGKKAYLSAWRRIAELYNTFCRFTRKDCMFLMDSVRATCLEGDQKIVRTTNIKNTIDTQITPKIKAQLNLNTSYGAGYCNWVYTYDQYSGLYFWLPPSIKTVGKLIYNDIYFNYWDAPAGFNRGVLNGVIDIAFNPTIEEAGRIYNLSWNYIVNYPMEGAVIEGQKTFQMEKTAFDRINVRRLFLKLEKYVYKISKRFVYEGNTEYTRQRFVDAIRPIFEEAKNGGGINDYVIICNEKNNGINEIENNELHCTIGVRPVKCVEFIILNFIALPQSGSFSEEQLLDISSNRYTEGY